ncbi:MAG: hypothetical protein HC819_24305, partial [Cyclobacteriaceae bacterium]|nr:hypothetical protein [Cyclobacteriaceae bacterium]
PARDLLLPAIPFPDGWEDVVCTINCARREGDVQALRSFVAPPQPGHVIQEVFKYRNDGDARESFDAYLKLHGAAYSPQSEAVPQSRAIHLPSGLVDDVFWGCGMDIVAGCEALLRYDHYFVYFYFSMASDDGYGLTDAEVEQVLVAFDIHIASIQEQHATD